LRILITLGNAEAIALAVQEGIGVGFISQMIIERICRGKVAEVSVRASRSAARFILVAITAARATSAQTAFWDFLSAEEQ